AANADDHVVGYDVLADDDPVERHGAHGGAGQVEAGGALTLRALDDVSHLRDLAGRDRDPRLPGAFRESFRALAQVVRVKTLDGQIVDHRDGLGADAEQVVHVHRDAIDPDRVVTTHHLRDQHLGAGAVRGNGETRLVRQADHIREVAEWKPDVPDAPGGT